MTSLAPTEGLDLHAGHADDPRGEIRTGAALASLFCIGLLGSAAFIPLDQANVVTGSVVVAGHRQAIQTREGGVVTVLSAADGDHVQAGQLLVSFAAADALAVERSLSSRLISKDAEIARLRAEQVGSRTVVLPAELTELASGDRAQIEEARSVAQIELNAQQSANIARRAVLTKRVEEAGDQILGYRRQLSSNARQQQLNDEELTGMRALLAQGYAPATRVRELERSAAGLVGDQGAESSEIGRLEATQGEAKLQITQGDAERSKDVADELDKAEAERQELLPQLTAARDILARTEVHAPVSGSVVASSINRVGAVVAPGQKLMEIVPARSDAIVEARVAPRDLEGFRVGQTARIQIVGVHDRRASALQAKITRVAADALIDDKTGQPFYTVSAAIAPNEVRRLPQGDELALRPGMPVTIGVTVRKRTALQYMFEPLFQSVAGGLHER